ncbi:MAG: hypothetical protein R6X32_09265 [Chloroflexota bacterium]
MKQWLRQLAWIMLGLAVGTGLGLYYGWDVAPTEFTNATPAMMQAEYQRDYLLMIAAAYDHSSDLATAERRLNKLGTTADSRLFDLMLDQILRDEDEQRIRQLVYLVADLDVGYSPAMDVYLNNRGEP